ncbi:hypothetical protein AK812_SmicGene46470 [Symbiodinium microadriaticum]|uniref:Uncharacterized protein n=1 Tax=Symbiodinium microadriaticum TaxID=2951 RepID=A0A1Q9BTS4_SYMMI|nr:hypothetical protein AK812_SmicGene46470 [Symbiodinium microadriaticum]
MFLYFQVHGYAVLRNALGAQRQNRFIDEFWKAMKLLEFYERGGLHIDLLWDLQRGNVTAPRPAPQPAPAATQEEEDDDYAQQRLDGRDYHDDWDRGAPSTAPRSQPAPAPRRRGGFPPIRQSYDDYDRHRAETERIWANADFDEPDRYWQQPPR